MTTNCIKFTSADIETAKGVGSISTLTFDLDITVEPVASTNPMAPTHRVLGRSPRGKLVESGGIWKKQNEALALGGRKIGVRRTPHISDAEAEPGRQAGSVADTVPSFLFSDSVDRANPRRIRMSAGRTGSLLSEASAPHLFIRATRAGSSWRSCQGAELTLCREGVNRRSTSCVRGATSHVRATAARLSVDLLAFQIASPGSSGRQRRGQVSGRLAP